LIISDLESTKWGNVDGFRGKCDAQQREANAKAFNYISKDAFIVDATGQAIESLQGHNLDQVLPFHHVDVVSTNNGLQIFTNEKGEDPYKFLYFLDPCNEENQDWKNYIEEILNFPASKLQSAFRSALEELGFKKTKDIGEDPGPRSYAYANHEVWNHDDTKIPFTLCSETNVPAAFEQATSDEEMEKAKKFLEQIIEKVTKTFSNVRGYIADQRPFCYSALFVPQEEQNHISKASLVPAILNLVPEGFWSNLDAVICLGDSGNDEHLGLSEIKNPDTEKMLPIYKVIAGKHLKDAQWIPNDGRIRTSESKGDIAKELESTIREISQKKT
jgi:hypothetical protein